MSFAKIFPFPNVLVSLRLISKGVALVKITVLAVFISIKNGFPFLRLEIRFLDTRSFQNTFEKFDEIIYNDIMKREAFYVLSNRIKPRTF